MKTIVAGSREITDYQLVWDAIYSCPWITEIVSGGARGVDLLGEKAAASFGIPVKVFPVTSADWEKFGKAAGIMRNQQMAEYADALIAIWDGESTGTWNMIKESEKRKMKVHIVRPRVMFYDDLDEFGF
jgi:hypothetical protein